MKTMSDQKIEALELSLLFEDTMEELEKKYYGGINKVLGLNPWSIDAASLIAYADGPGIRH